jgi:hypothetical protein
MSETTMTHKQLVRRMAQWLKGTKRATVVMAELSTANSETPDVIGWMGGAHSTMIECKVSRADFWGDRNKWFRRDGEDGMGDRRFFAAPIGLLRIDEIPEGWGLLEVDYRCVRMTKDADHVSANKRRECIMLMSALRRLEIATAVYVVSDTGQDGGKAE